MRISFKSLIDIGLVIIFYAGFQGGKYFFNNRVQELGILITLLIFLFGATRLALENKMPNWRTWFWLAPLFVLYVMGGSAVVFSINAGTAIAPSLFAAREFMIVFLAPALFFLYKTGYPIARIEAVFVLTIVIILLNYLFHYFRIDLESAYFSTGYMSYLVTYDDWRGYRLKPPTFGLFIISTYCLHRIMTDFGQLKMLTWIAILGIAGYIWSLIMARSQMATLGLAMFCYPFLFSRPNRMNLLLLISPVGIFLIVALSGFMIDSFMHAEGAEVRAASYSLAWDTIKAHPLFGYGQSSGYSKTYQDIFGHKFFPSDLGIIGLTFKYGFIGAFIYIFFNFYLLRKLIIANWLYKHHYGKTNSLIWAILILFIALTVNMILNPGLAYMQGLTVASFVIAITAAYHDQYKRLFDRKNIA